tara:strand:+ start:26472 stop:27845 length:1374 start_codon:yes stop_codon:yes gene_type:complete
MSKKFIVIIIFIFLGIIYFFINLTISNENFRGIKSILSLEQKNIIKKYIFPYTQISILEKKILDQKKKLRMFRPWVYKSELYFKESLQNIKIKKNEDIKLSENMIMSKYTILDGFYTGLSKIKPGGYIDFHQNNILILSARGILAYNDNISNKLHFKQIKNNINDFISFEQFKRDFSKLTDLYIYENKIYIAYTDEIKKDCFNTSVIYGDMNYQEIKFKKYFASQDCISSPSNAGYYFAARSGGRIQNFDNNHILLSTGEYGERFLAQEKDNINGKVIKINPYNSDFEIISMGHRNPQGLFYDKDNNFILQTEHGPYGGDEINLIEIDEININNPLNYGWAISSYGEHYDPKTKENEEMYKRYPLYKSHEKHGFIEPLKHFSPAIAPSEITKINKNRYVACGMKAKSIFFFELNDKKEIINFKKVNIFERVRDIKFHNNTIYLFLEDTVSIGIIKLN